MGQDALLPLWEPEVHAHDLLAVRTAINSLVLKPTALHLYQAFHFRVAMRANRADLSLLGLQILTS
jgi:hypothetical protein